MSTSSSLFNSRALGNITRRQDLFQVWRSGEIGNMASKGVICFYGHSSEAQRPYFSNFWEHRGFTFQLPECCHRNDPVFKKPIRDVEFAEKAIMLCKAARFRDYEVYDRLLHTYTPRNCKKLGRQVSNFQSDSWDEVVLTVAEEVVYQKFSKVRELTALLLETGDSIIAEATVRDLNWACGFNTTDPEAQHPWEWRGTNVLGWALMKARDRIRSSSEHHQEESL